MKKVLVFILACFACTAVFAQTHFQPVTTGQDLGPTNIFVNCCLYIDHELQALPNYEIAVFDQNDVCRGAKLPTYVQRFDWYYYNITVKGNEGFTYYFRIWDHETDTEVTNLELDIEEEIIWRPNMYKYGSATAPYELNFHNTGAPVVAITKDIIGYGEEAGHWYLISSPVGDVDIDAVDGMMTDAFDLYAFDQTHELEWINHEGENAFTTLVQGHGYLYASQTSTTLTFPGNAVTGESIAVDLIYDENAAFAGWNLVGNPFNETATIDFDGDVYVMENATDLVANEEDGIPAMAGILFQTSEAGTVTFTPAPNGKNASKLVLNLTGNERGVIDRAVVRFGQCRQLPKLQLNPNHTKVCFSVEGEDFASVRSEGMGELPVTFKAEKSGTYTLSANAEGVTFGYLHLIDNLTGADVDLLASPSYTFEASYTDYANRFKLVFVANDGNDNDSFAFFSNGSFVINNEGLATLQVVDVTGRILKSETVEGCANVSVNAAPGVYMLRLVNGENVRVQKVIVK